MAALLSSFTLSRAWNRLCYTPTIVQKLNGHWTKVLNSANVPFLACCCARANKLKTFCYASFAQEVHWRIRYATEQRGLIQLLRQRTLKMIRYRAERPQKKICGSFLSGKKNFATSAGRGNRTHDPLVWCFIADSGPATQTARPPNQFKFIWRRSAHSSQVRCTLCHHRQPKLWVSFRRGNCIGK